MKKIVLLLTILMTSISFSQELNLGTGILEESRKLGVGFPVSAGVDMDITRNFTSSLTYMHGFLETGHAKLYTVGGDVLTQNEPGSKIDQLQLMLGYKFYSDKDLAFSFNAGAATQFDGEIYKTFKINVIAYPSSKIHPYLSWSPVIRGKFDEGSGWSHTVTMNIAFKIS